jgi:WD40 repeat protein
MPSVQNIVSLDTKGPLLLLNDNLSFDTLIQNMETGAIIQRLPTRSHGHSLIVSRTGQWLVANDMSELTIWNLWTGEQVVSVAHDPGGGDLAFSADETLFAFTSRDVTCECGIAQILAVQEGAQPTLLSGYHGSTATVAFSNDNTSLVTGGTDEFSNSIRLWIWDVKTLKLQEEFAGSSGWITNVLYSPDSHFITATGSLGSVWLLDITVADQRTMMEIVPNSNNLYLPPIDFSPDSTMLAIGTQVGDILLVNTTKGAVVATLSVNMEQIIGVRFSPDGRLLASNSADGTVRLWQVGMEDDRTIRMTMPTRLPDATWVASPPVPKPYPTATLTPADGE